MEQPFTFTIAVRDFDMALLPENAQEPGTDAFEVALAAFYAGQFTLMGGTVGVSVDDQTLTVEWMPDEVSEHPCRYAVRLLKSGNLADGVGLLRALLPAWPNDPELLFNLGMAESDLGELRDAIEHLKLAVEADPDSANMRVALGVAYHRNQQSGLALAELREAIRLEPENGHAHRNLAGLLANEGEPGEAEHHFREACTLMPGDQTAVFNLAQCLEHLGGEERALEADGLYRSVIAAEPGSELAEQGRTALRRLAAGAYRAAGGVAPRMDAVMYCLDALRRFREMAPADIRNVAFEIATLGRRGLDVNNPTQRYSIQALPGSFSGLQLVSLMYVAFKQIGPEMDLGFDLRREYEAAQSLHER